MRSVFAVLVMLAGCGVYQDGTFTCTTDPECGSGGKCAAGFCSFVDPRCPSGYRYGDYSGPSSKDCVAQLSAPRCASSQPATIFDGFDGSGASCGAGGFLNENGTIDLAQTSGVLQITPTGVGGAYCTWDPFTLGGGMIAHLPRAMIGNSGDDTTLAIYCGTGCSFVEFQVRGVNQQLTVDDGTSTAGTIAWNPATTSWLRLTPAADAMHITGAYSRDGDAWTDLGTMLLGAPTTDVKLVFGSGNGQATSATDITQLDAIYTCP